MFWCIFSSGDIVHDGDRCRAQGKLPQAAIGREQGLTCESDEYQSASVCREQPCHTFNYATPIASYQLINLCMLLLLEEGA